MTGSTCLPSMTNPFESTSILEFDGLVLVPNVKRCCALAEVMKNRARKAVEILLVVFMTEFFFAKKCCVLLAELDEFVVRSEDVKRVVGEEALADGVLTLGAAILGV